MEMSFSTQANLCYDAKVIFHLSMKTEFSTFRKTPHYIN